MDLRPLSGCFHLTIKRGYQVKKRRFWQDEQSIAPVMQKMEVEVLKFLLPKTSLSSTFVEGLMILLTYVCHTLDDRNRVGCSFPPYGYVHLDIYNSYACFGLASLWSADTDPTDFCSHC